MYRQISKTLAMGSILLLIFASLAGAGDSGLVSMLTSQLGVTQPQAEGGAGAIFKLAKQKMSPADFLKVSESVPEASSLLDKAPVVEAAAGAVEEKKEDVKDAAAEKTESVTQQAASVTEALPGAPTDVKIPGKEAAAEKAAETVSEAAETKEESGGLAGALGSAASMAGGSSSGLGSLGGAAGSLGALGSLSGSFSKLGMSSDMAGKFMPIVLDYAKSKGGEAVSGLLLKSLM